MVEKWDGPRRQPVPRDLFWIEGNKAGQDIVASRLAPPPGEVRQARLDHVCYSTR
jgi:hypothetical protein